MKYLCLGYHDEQAWAAMPRQERDALLEETFAYQELLREGGHYLRGDALQSAQNAATLRFKSGEVLLTDGPFAETKEQLGGLMMLEASDLNQAIALMSKLPCMRIGGSVEIRPVNRELSDAATASSAAVERI